MHGKGQACKVSPSSSPPQTIQTIVRPTSPDTKTTLRQMSSGLQSHGRVATACLLYTSDAADDM
eukprot:7442359-Alexandrium_andersonii.AAC.1